MHLFQINTNFSREDTNIFNVTSIRSSFKFHHFLAEVPRAACKKVTSLAGEESLHICLVEDNVNKPGTCCSSSLLTEGPLVWHYICLSKLVWGLIRDKEHYISRFCRNTLRLKTVREVHSERTPKLHFFFVSQHGNFLLVISMVTEGCTDCRMGIQWVLKGLRDGRWQSLGMGILKYWSSVKKLTVIKCPLSSVNSNIIS